MTSACFPCRLVCLWFCEPKSEEAAPPSLSSQPAPPGAVTLHPPAGGPQKTVANTSAGAGCLEPCSSPHSVISLQFHLRLAESRLNNLFGRYHKPTPGAVGSARVKEARAGMTSRADTRTWPWRKGTRDLQKAGEGAFDPRESVSSEAHLQNGRSHTHPIPLGRDEEIKRPLRPGVQCMGSGYMRVPPPTSLLTRHSELDPQTGSETAQRTCWVSLPPSSLPSAMPGTGVHTQGTAATKASSCSQGVDNKQVNY